MAISFSRECNSLIKWCLSILLTNGAFKSSSDFISWHRWAIICCACSTAHSAKHAFKARVKQCRVMKSLELSTHHYGAIIMYMYYMLHVLQVQSLISHSFCFCLFVCFFFIKSSTLMQYVMFSLHDKRSNIQGTFLNFRSNIFHFWQFSLFIPVIVVF